MGSLFEKDPTAKPVHGAFAPERLVKEVDHLEEEKRLNAVHPLVRYGRVLGGFLLLIALSLYFLDPFVFASRKTQAIRAYLYQRQHGDEKVAAALLYSGYFDEQERAVLQNRKGNFMEFFETPDECKRVANESIRYIDTLRGIHTGNLGNVDALNRIRYYLFLYPGILPPMPVAWATMTPRVDSKYVP